MSRKKANSDWVARSRDLPTRPSLVLQARTSEAARFELMMYYRTAIEEYLTYLLCKEKGGRNQEIHRERAKDLWRVWVLPFAQDRLAADDQHQGGFRDRLVIWIHQAFASSFKRANVPPNATDELAWRDANRNTCLAAAKDRLKRLEQTATRKNYYFTLLELHEQWPQDSTAQLGKRLSEKVGKPFRANTVTTMLGRGYDKLGAFLVDEVRQRSGCDDRDRLWEEIEALNLKYIVDQSGFIRKYFTLDGDEPELLQNARDRLEKWCDESPQDPGPAVTNSHCR